MQRRDGSQGALRVVQQHIEQYRGVNGRHHRESGGGIHPHFSPSATARARAIFQRDRWPIFPRYEQTILAADFEGLSGGQAELLAQLARQGQLAVFRYNRRHGCKLP